MAGTCYDVTYRGVRYTPAHQSMIRIKDDQGRTVASIQVNGTYGVHAHHKHEDDDDDTLGEYHVEVDHQSWEPVDYTKPGVKEISDGRDQ